MEVNQSYRDQIEQELTNWKSEFEQAPSSAGQFVKSIQHKVNDAIPEKAHQEVTKGVKKMVQFIITGSNIVSDSPKSDEENDLSEIDRDAHDLVEKYSSAAGAEGALTGAGGFLTGMADFPAWLGIKLKLLVEIASMYNLPLRKWHDRLFLLYIFQLTFSQKGKNDDIISKLWNWESFKTNLPSDPEQFDWKKFQQEYRDYLDLAKILQLIPGLGALVGAYINTNMTRKLGENAIRSCQRRILNDK